MPAPTLEDLGLIGNCQYSALEDRRGAVVWCCLPAFDAEPVFATLLDAGRVFDRAAGRQRGVQRYLPNTNVLQTTFHTIDRAFRVLDFAPRYFSNRQIVLPTEVIRIVEPLEGTPQVTIRCRPRLGWSQTPAPRQTGSDYLDFGELPAAAAPGVRSFSERAGWGLSRSRRDTI